MTQNANKRNLIRWKIRAPRVSRIANSVDTGLSQQAQVIQVHKKQVIIFIYFFWKLCEPLFTSSNGNALTDLFLLRYSS